MIWAFTTLLLSLYAFIIFIFSPLHRRFFNWSFLLIIIIVVHLCGVMVVIGRVTVYKILKYTVSQVLNLIKVDFLDNFMYRKLTSSHQALTSARHIFSVSEHTRLVPSASTHNSSTTALFIFTEKRTCKILLTLTMMMMRLMISYNK